MEKSLYPKGKKELQVISEQHTFSADLCLQGLIKQKKKKAFLPHEFMSCANAILIKDCDVALWQNK